MMNRPIGFIANAIEIGTAFTGLLDTYTGAGIAAGVRRLSSTYTGPLMRIIRASDSSVTDISYDTSGHLDTAAISTFCSGTTGYILYLYDQSGNGYNVIGYNSGSTTDNLPVIYTGSAVVTLNGKAAIRIHHPRWFRWTNNEASMSKFYTGGAAGADKRATIHFVGAQSSSATNPFKFEMEDITAVEFLAMYEDTSAERIDLGGSSAANAGTPPTYRDDVQSHFISQVEGSAWKFIETGSLIFTSTNNSVQNATKVGINFFVGSRTLTTQNIDAYLQELIVWPTAYSASGLWSDVNTYYSIG